METTIEALPKEITWIILEYVGCPPITRMVCKLWESINTPTDTRQTLEYVIKNGYTGLLEWLYHVDFRIRRRAVWLLATKYGIIPILDDLYEFYGSYPPLSCTPIREIVNVAARYNQIPVLEWLHSKELGITCDAKHYAITIGAGHVDMLEWYRLHGIRYLTPDIIEDIAVKCNQPSVAQWARGVPGYTQNIGSTILNSWYLRVIDEAKNE